MTDLVATWRRIIIGSGKSWVLFANGTCVILMEPAEDLAAQAVDLLRQYGPVQVGTPSADFTVITLTDAPGWVVTGHHNDVLTYVGPDEVSEPHDIAVGITGRGKRDLDGRELVVLHVEDQRM